MNRKEQIFKEVETRFPGFTTFPSELKGLQLGFIAGAEWADVNPRPIDWKLVWAEYQREMWFGIKDGRMPDKEKIIQEFVEKQLRGEK